MTRREAIKIFNQTILPHLTHRDPSAKRMAWSVWTDGLHKDGVITDRQVNTWLHAPSCHRRG